MGYTITNVERTNFLDNRGVAVDGYRVWFEMSTGQVDYIEITKSQYNADNVKAAIESEIEQHQAIVG